MAAPRAHNTVLGDLSPDKKQRKGSLRRAGQTETLEAQNLEKEEEVEQEQQKETLQQSGQNEQQDLIQGMQTGTHDSIRHGIRWGPSYQVRATTNQKGRKKKAPAKKSI